MEKYFVEATYARMRDTVIQQLAPTTSRTIVTDTVACQAALDAALTVLQASDFTRQHTADGGYTHAVMRFGPYTLVRFEPFPETSTGTASEWIPLLIFRTSDLTYLRTWMI